MDKHKTMVVFRVWKENDDMLDDKPIALFPCKPNWLVGLRHGYCMSYDHLGKLGHASYSGVMAETRAATPEEAFDLADQLKAMCYNLAVRQKRPSVRYEKKWREMGNR